jgi:small nuclear ribonucleoprotein (snRNP)-like protein
MLQTEIDGLTLLMNFLAMNFLRKSSWKDVSKAEWGFVVELLNDIYIANQKKLRIKNEKLLLGTNYLYEHIVIHKLIAAQKTKNIKNIAVPQLSKLTAITQQLGYNNYFEFIDKHSNAFNFDDLKINIPNTAANTILLNALVGHWYSYNRNLPDTNSKTKEERIWRSAIEIYKSTSGNEYLIERSGGDQHKYYGKVTAFDDYIFIIMNSNTFIRQRHFIARIKDVNEKLKQPTYNIEQIHFISTCISFNKEPIALFEIFERVNNIRSFVNASIDYPIQSNEIPKHILVQIKDASKNRIINH